MAAFEVTTDTDRITVTWTNDDIKSLASFTIELDHEVKYSQSSPPASPYRLTGLTAGTRYIMEIQVSTTDGETHIPVVAQFTTSM